MDHPASQTPIKADLKVPVGHILVNSKWRNTILGTNLQGSVQILYEDETGVVDFYLPDGMGVVYLTEPELITSSTYKRKLAKLRKANSISVLVVAERTSTSGQYFSALQKFCTLELGFTLIPVPSQREAAGLLAQLVHAAGHSDNNPFCKKATSPPLDAALLTTVQCLPKLGAVKAKGLLDTFQSLQGISSASEEDMCSVLGRTSAVQIRKFFNDSPTEQK